jgi:ribonuclease T2
MLDLMPAPHLIFNEWDRHGTCSGVSPRAYFETVRKARAVVKIPPDYIDLQAPLSVSPAAVGDAFIKANPGLTQDGISVGCDSKRLTEVRLCLSRELQFHDCPEVARRSCRRDQVLMPPLRGGSGSAAAVARDGFLDAAAAPDRSALGAISARIDCWPGAAPCPRARHSLQRTV